MMRACASTRFLVSPTCSPTRAAMMSGRHPMKNGITHTILERERMALSTVTLPQVLKAAGYTTGIFGKWHLGDEEQYQPHNARLRRGVHPRCGRDRAGVRLLLCGRAEEQVLRSGDPPQWILREDRRLLHGSLLHGGARLDQGRSRRGMRPSLPTSRPTHRTGRSSHRQRTPSASPIWDSRRGQPDSTA